MRLLYGINYIELDTDSIDNLMQELQMLCFGYSKKMVIVKNSGLFKKDTKKKTSGIKEIRDNLEKYLKENPPKRMLEIGTAVGYSAICFTEYLSDDGIIDTIEREADRVVEAKENIKKAEVENKIKIYEGDAVEILPKLNEKYDAIFIDAAKGKYPFFLKESLRMLNKNGIIFADNILYKGYVMSDYNKHKQRTAVNHLREYIKNVTENPNLFTEILEVGDGLAITNFIM